MRVELMFVGQPAGHSFRSLGTKEKIGQLIVPPLLAEAGEEAHRLAADQIEEWGAGGFISMNCMSWR